MRVTDEKHNAELKETEEKLVADKDEKLEDAEAAEIAAKGIELSNRQASETGPLPYLQQSPTFVQISHVCRRSRYPISLARP